MTAKVIQFVEHLSHVVEKVRCFFCGHLSIDVRPEQTSLKICECAGCGRVGTLEVQSSREHPVEP